jgi:hypothetical protein
MEGGMHCDEIAVDELTGEGRRCLLHVPRDVAARIKMEDEKGDSEESEPT